MVGKRNDRGKAKNFKHEMHCLFRLKKLLAKWLENTQTMHLTVRLCCTGMDRVTLCEAERCAWRILTSAQADSPSHVFPSAGVKVEG